MGDLIPKKQRLINLIAVLLSTVTTTSLILITEAIIEMVSDSIEDHDFDSEVIKSLVASIRSMAESVESQNDGDQYAFAKNSK